jgi:hypothetical protein
MKKIFVTLCITLTVFSVAYSQAFVKSEIITKENDTLDVFVQLLTSYDKVVPYKLTPDSDILYKKIKSIRSLKTPYNTYENIAVKNNEELFRVAVKGDLSLLTYNYHKQNNTGNINPNAYYAEQVRVFEVGVPTKIVFVYAVRCKDATYIIKKKKDVRSIKPLFNQCPDIVKLIEDKSFKLEDLEGIIEQYNNKK